MLAHPYMLFCPVLCRWFSFVPINIRKWLSNVKSISICTLWKIVIANCVHFVLTIIFPTGSRMHCPSKLTSILKHAAGSAILQSFHFRLASLLWLHCSWYTWILCKLSRFNKLLTLLRNHGECNLILIPVTLYFVFPPHCLESLHFNEGGNAVPHTNLWRMPWWRLLALIPVSMDLETWERL